MTQVKLHQTVSQEIINDANKEISVDDARGRKIVLKKPSFRSQFKLTEVLGADLSKNEALRGMYFPLYYVHSIDGDSNIFLNSKLDLDALIDRLEEEGYSAVAKGIMDNFSLNLNNEGEIKDQIKK